MAIPAGNFGQIDPDDWVGAGNPTTETQGWLFFGLGALTVLGLVLVLGRRATPQTPAEGLRGLGHGCSPGCGCSPCRQRWGWG